MNKLLLNLVFLIGTIVSVIGCNNSPTNDQPIADTGKRSTTVLSPSDSKLELKPSPVYVRLNQTKELLELFNASVKKDNCTVEWGGPSSVGGANDQRDDPREFDANYQQNFRFRVQDGKELSCEPDDVQRILPALKTRLEQMIVQSGGQVLKSKEELGLQMVNSAGGIDRVTIIKERLGAVNVDYAQESGNAFARGTVRASIHLEEYSLRLGILTLSFKETVTSHQVGQTEP